MIADHRFISKLLPQEKTGMEETGVREFGPEQILAGAIKVIIHGRMGAEGDSIYWRVSCVRPSAWYRVYIIKTSCNPESSCDPLQVTHQQSRHQKPVLTTEFQDLQLLLSWSSWPFSIARVRRLQQR